jgi:hypothetical protein
LISFNGKWSWTKKNPAPGSNNNLKNRRNKMTKVLELQFVTEFGKSAQLAVDYPKEPVIEADVTATMNVLIANNVFQSSSGALTTVKGARLVERTVQELTV